MTTDRTLFVHLGPPKTGTTALQKYLTANAPDTLIYPRSGTHRSAGHHALAEAISGQAAFFGPGLAPDEILKQVKEELRRSDKDAIISSEAFWSFLFDSEDYLAKMHRWFSEVCENTVYLCTLRHPLARAASLYKQLVVNVVLPLQTGPDEFLKSSAKSLLLNGCLDRMDALGMAYRTVDYEPAGDFVPRFLTALGHPVQDYTYEASKASLSDMVLPVMLCVNRAIEDRDTRLQIRRAFTKHSADWPRLASAWAFGEETTAWFSDQIESDRERLAERGIEYPALQQRSHFKLTDLMRQNLQDFLGDQFRDHESEVSPNVDTDDVIETVLAYFS